MTSSAHEKTNAKTNVKRKITYLAIAIVAVVFATFYIGGRLVGDLSTNTKIAEAHLYKQPSVSIKDIQMDIFYAVPKGRTEFDHELVKTKLFEMMPKISSFHKSQFGGKSTLHYEIFPGIVPLQEDGIFYDTDDTKYGNPQALKNVTLELEARVYSPAGDLYDGNFITPKDRFRVIAIIYEGLGAAGTEGVVLLSRDFISRDEYSPISASLFYHEFGHAMGIPEGYDILTNRPFTNDIMGSGRRAPIEGNHIDQSTLKEMGVF